MNNKIFERLDALGIEYKTAAHPPMFTMDDIYEYGIEACGHIPKNLVLRNVNGSRNMLVLIHGDKRADLRLIRAQLETSKLSFASEERLKKYLSVEKGSVSPLGLIFDADTALEVYIDIDIKDESIVGCHPNNNRATVFLSFNDLIKYIESTSHKIEFIKV